MKPTAPGLFSHIFSCDLLFLSILFRSIKPKIQKYYAAIYFICDLLFQSTTIFWHRYLKGIDNPFNTWVLRCCYLCAGAVYVVLLGSPTGLIPWFSKTEGNTYATLLHHPFLFKGEPTQCSIGSKKDF